MARSLGSAGRTAATFRTALADPQAARLLIAWLSINAGKWGFLIVNLVAAYDAGGAVAVSLLGVARYLTPTIVAPLSGLPIARWAPDRVLHVVHVLRTLTVAGALVIVATGAPIELLFLSVAVEAGVGAFTRPIHMGLLPSVARSPEQLVATNVASSAVEGLGTFIGPAVAGLLLAEAGAATALAGVLAIYALGAIALIGLRVPVFARPSASIAAVRAQVLAGLRALADGTGTRLIVIGITLQTMVRGLLVVLTVVAAIELLGMGEAGVGALNAAMGIGGFVGAVVAATLAGRRRLIPAFAVSIAAWGAPIAVVGLVATPTVALAMMLLVGTANAVLDVAGFTLIQRLTPNERRVAVLGLVDSVANGGVAIGGIVAPFLVEALGIEVALIVTGAILPIAAIVLWPWLRRVDEVGTVDPDRLSLVRGVPLFTPLSLAATEHVAGCLRPARFASGTTLMAEGAAGDRFVILAAGTADVIQHGTRLRAVGPGEGVGEIALLRDVPRTASIVATADIEAWSLDRDDFLAAVLGDGRSEAIATAIADARLAASPDGHALH